MRRSLLGWIVAFALALAFGGAAFAWVWFARGSGEPSTELTTPTIASGPESTTSTAVASTTSEASATSETTARTGQAKSFVIVSEHSVAGFEIDEELRGSPTRVVGTTNQVAGQVRVDPADLSTAQFSEIVINARTFETGSAQRDRAIRGPVILDSATDEFEFITFEVTSVHGREGAVSVGETLEVTVTGDLTVRGVTSEETFEASITFVNGSTIEGTATTTVSRETYGIGIPSVPGVANVGDEVQLDLHFFLTSS